MSQKSNQAVKTVSLMMMITLVGKVLGLVREQFLAALYGNTAEAAAFATASLIPRTFFDAIFASAISASFIPIFNECLKKKGRDEAFRLADSFITLIGLVTVAMMAIGMVGAEPLVKLFAGGLAPETIALSVNLVRMLLPTMLFTAIAFSFVGILQSLDEFNVPAAISVASNSVIILYYVFFNSKFGVYGLTIAFLIGWAMQALVQIPSLWKNGYYYRPRFAFRDEGIRKIGKLMLPVMVSTWIQPINFMINNHYASFLENGDQSVTGLNYANTLYTIVVGVFVLAIANLIFPRLSKISSEGNEKEFGQTLGQTLRSMMFLLVPMMVGLMALSEPIVRLVYQRGEFDETATAITSTVLFFFSLGMIGYGIQAILSRAFYAKQNGKLPFYSGVISIGVNLGLCVLLMKPMGVGGLALASAISSITAATILFIPTMKQYPEVLNKKTIVALGQMALSALAMVVLVVASYNFLSVRCGDTLIARLLLVGIPAMVGVISYMVFTYLLKIDESRMFFGALAAVVNKSDTAMPLEARSAQGSQNREEMRGYLGMVHFVSDILEDSFCFRFIAVVLRAIANVWKKSIAYSIYRGICNGFTSGFDNSTIVGFFRKDWDDGLRVKKSVIPRAWRRMVAFTSREIKEQRSDVGFVLSESLILRILGPNFLILCLCAIVFGIPVLPTMLLVLLAAGTLFVYLLNVCLGRIHRTKSSMVSVLLGLFGVCVIYGTLSSFNFPRALQVMAVFMVFMGIFVARNCIDTEEKLDFVLFVMISTGTLIALYAIYQYVVGVEMDAAWVDADSFDIRTRAYATFSNPNVLGEYLIVIASVAAGMLWKVRRWFSKLYFTGCFGILCLGLVATNSRGAMLGLLFSAGLFVLFGEKKLVPVGVAGLFAMPFILPASLWARLASSITMSDSSSVYRMSIYHAGIEMVKNYPLTGIGVDAFNQIYPLFSREAANAYHVHNLFLQELIELGFVGFGILVALLIFFFQKLYSSMHRIPVRFRMLLASIFGGFAGLLLQGMTDHIWFDYSIVLLFWCFMGIGMAGIRVGEKAWQKEKQQ